MSIIAGAIEAPKYSCIHFTIVNNAESHRCLWWCWCCVLWLWPPLLSIVLLAGMFCVGTSQYNWRTDILKLCSQISAAKCCSSPNLVYNISSSTSTIVSSFHFGHNVILPTVSSLITIHLWLAVLTVSPSVITDIFRLNKAT